ncbi:hypothetical protein LDENG_00032010 [Lucifuga dentata]|nr:hypothetical protein LDENG_00032010 [Lucifuga dentata]
MMDPKNNVNHQQATQLLHNKFVVVLGDSIQRAVYKDIVLLLQKEKYLTHKQLKSKGEMSFEQDCLIEGGCLGHMHNGTEYREVRQFQSDHHLVRFYFLTRIYSDYMRSILNDFYHGLKPDVVIINSCLWDISRYRADWIDDYMTNLRRFFDELNIILPQETLVIWNLTMPVGHQITGGFLVPEIEHLAPQLRQDVIKANFYSGTLADACGMDVLDFHFQFRFSLQHRMKDGIHWNELAHRRLTCLLLRHIAEAWGIIIPSPLTLTAGFCPSLPSPAALCWPKEGHHDDNREEFYKDSLPFNFLSFEEYTSKKLQPQKNWNDGPARYRAPDTHQPSSFICSPSYHFEPYNAPSEHHDYVMRSRHHRHHYAPYTHYRYHYAPYTHYRPSYY